MKDLILAQIELEKGMTAQSVHNYQKEYKATIDRGGVNQPESKLISFSLGTYSEAIKKYLEAYSLGNVVRRPVAAIKLTELLKTISLEQVAFIAMQSIFSSLNQKPNGQKLARRISSSLEWEEKAKKYKRYNSAYYTKLMSELQERNARVDWKLTALQHSFTKKFNFISTSWTVQQQVQVGLILLEIYIQSTGYLEWKKVWERGKSYNYVVATEETLKWVEKEAGKQEMLNPFLLPMICSPKPWISVLDGGYISPFLKKFALVKRASKAYLKELDRYAMPEVFDAINALQNTAWQVNTDVLEVVQQLWELNKPIAGLPDREDKAPPAFPYPELDKKATRTEQQQAIIRSWKNEAVATYKQNVQIRSVRILTAQILSIATQFSKYNKIWFPYQLDFRGRMYPIPVLFQPQGNDLAKGLLRFGEGKRIENEENLDWLRVHGANCFGVDKVSYQDRVKWIKEKEEEIKQYAEDPINNQGWTEADKPFQFLAFCREYAQVLTMGYDFVSHLPIYVDGTCNGLQHYSALLRDEEGGRAVNLTDAEIPSDIYAIVADKVSEKLRDNRFKINDNIHEVTDIALINEKLLEIGINRKLTKRPVMTLPYGATAQSRREYVEEYLLDNYSLSFLHEHFGKVGREPKDTVFKVSNVLAKLIWEAISETLTSAIIGMGYIRKKLTGHKRRTIEWITPCGFLVSQHYPNTRIIEVSTELFGKTKLWEYMTPDKGVDPYRQANGICPNFIHSLDAAALMKYLNKASQEGITSFGAVHDSYGTLAADVTNSQRILREAFVDIYNNQEDEKCVLELFIEDVTEEEVKDLPDKGELNISDVLESRYFFN